MRGMSNEAGALELVKRLSHALAQDVGRRRKRKRGTAALRASTLHNDAASCTGEQLVGANQVGAGERLQLSDHDVSRRCIGRRKPHRCCRLLQRRREGDKQRANQGEHEKVRRRGRTDESRGASLERAARASPPTRLAPHT